MLEKMLQKVRLLIVGFGFGAILAGTICAWGVMPVQFKIFFCLALFITFYFAVRFTLLSHKEYTYNEQNNPYSQRD